MQEFKFYQDEKITVWQRHYFSVQAETQEEANEKVKELADISLPDTEQKDVKFLESEMKYDTAEELPIKDNDYNPTLELYNKDGDRLYNNMGFDYKKQ